MSNCSRAKMLNNSLGKILGLEGPLRIQPWGSWGANIEKIKKIIVLKNIYICFKKIYFIFEMPT